MIRVLIVDDQALVRSGFRVILDSQPDIEVVGEAADGVEAVQLATELDPHVICMDVEMPNMNGIEAARRILADDPQPGPNASRTAVLVLTTFGHDEYLFDALEAGVSGFLLKTSRAEQLIDAVRTLAAGNALLGPDVTRAVMQRAASFAQPAKGAGGDNGGVAGGSVAARDSAAADGSAVAGGSADGGGALSPNHDAMDKVGLTEREREVLLLVAAGKSNGEIASELFLGEATVKTHVSNLLHKIGARDRVQLVVWVHSKGAV